MVKYLFGDNMYFAEISLNMIYLSVMGMVIGIILGSRIDSKMNIGFYLISGIIIAYLLGAFPYYNFPISCAFILSIFGILIGNAIHRLFKK
jgi:energy-converting hydrogenase B subunit J